MLMCFVSVIQQINVESFLSLFFQWNSKQNKTKPSQAKQKIEKPNHYNAYQPVI